MRNYLRDYEDADEVFGEDLLREEDERIARHGERISVRMMAMDHSSAEENGPTVSADGFVQLSDQQIAARDKLYDERCRSIMDQWRKPAPMWKRPLARAVEKPERTVPNNLPKTREEARRLSDALYEERRRELESAWKTGR
jgi:hypothetical protein